MPYKFNPFTGSLDETGGATGATGTVSAAGPGSAAAPSISFAGDTDTGLFNAAADTLAFAEGGVEAMRIDSAGRLLVGTATATASGAKLQTVDGLTFPVNVVASADANTLDDYEEGTWTPSTANFTLSGSSTLTGTYTKIGRVVYFGVTFANTGTIAWSASALITLPFAGVHISGMVAMSLAIDNESQTSGRNGVQIVIDAANARFFVGAFTATSAGQQLNFGGFYRVS